MSKTSKTFKRFSVSIFCYTVILTACATAPKFDDNSSTKIDPAEAKNFKLKVSSSKAKTGTVDYKFKNSNFKSQWVTCTGNTKDPFVALFGTQDGVEAEKFCNDWMAQAALQNGLNVVAVNRPGKGQSSGKDDFGGPLSVAGALDGIKAAVGSNPLVGFWGYDTGTITATFTAKSFSGLKWLILGNGFYDLEVVERTSKSDAIIKTIAALKVSDGDLALEQRSIAWDTAKLPSRIALYHSRNDHIAPKAQADSFNDQLRTIQTKVTFDDIEGGDHDLLWQSHFQIAAKILKSLPR
jgi:hypothetical protein